MSYRAACAAYAAGAWSSTTASGAFNQPGESRCRSRPTKGRAQEKGENQKTSQEGACPADRRKPSIQLLRHRNESVDPVTKVRLHTFLAGKLGVTFPTAADEAQEQAAADRLYESATRWLLEQTRDTSKLGLLFTENISYGFRRNMLGMRWIGFTAAVSAAIWLVVDSATAVPATAADLSSLLITLPSAHRLGLIVCALAGAVWILGVSEERVRAAAFAYAERLVAACDALADRSPAASVLKSPSPSPAPNASRAAAD